MITYDTLRLLAHLVARPIARPLVHSRVRLSTRTSTRTPTRPLVHPLARLLVHLYVHVQAYSPTRTSTPSPSSPSGHAIVDCVLGSLSLGVVQIPKCWKAGMCFGFVGHQLCDQSLFLPFRRVCVTPRYRKPLQPQSLVCWATW